MCKNHNILGIWPLDIVSNKHQCPAISALFCSPQRRASGFLPRPVSFRDGCFLFLTLACVILSQLSCEPSRWEPCLFFFHIAHLDSAKILS